MMAASDAITPPITQPRASALNRASVLSPSMAAKNKAVKARYHDVISHIATPSSSITVQPEMLYPMLISTSSTANGMTVGESVSPPMQNSPIVRAEMTS